ncbi:MAG TPA: hypothetical protein VFS60_13460 [Thermoanaerobaculia bacterium]|nr:hypothetical protein [Thermoanaerobaculia bacterium]
MKRTHHVFAIALAIALSFVAAESGAQGPTGWTLRGPFCRRPFGIAAPKAIAAPAYLAVGGSLFRGDQGWATWSQVGEQLPTSYLSAVAAAPQNAQLVYFAPWNGGGVYRSSDGGETWSHVFLTLPDQLVEWLTVPAAPAGTVFAIAPYSGIYRSRDRGETWTDVSPPEARPTNYFGVVDHAVQPDRLMAHTLGGFWRSDDGGNRWRSWNAGLTATSLAGPRVFAWAPTAPDVAFVGSYSTLYRSDRGGAWKRVGPMPVNQYGYVDALAAGPGRKPVLFAGQDGTRSYTAGVARSSDGGRTWQASGLVGETVVGLSYLPASGRVVALTERGAFYSSDLGRTWRRTGAGIAASDVLSITAVGSDRKVLVAGLERCPGGIARSPDGGATWQIQELRDAGRVGGSYLSEPTAIAVAPSRPSRVYAAAMDHVLRSDDAGITWAAHGFADSISGGRAAGIAVHPTDPEIVFVAGQHGLSRSRDGGRTWSGGLHEYPYNDMSAVVFDPTQPQRLLAASWYGGLTRSVDGGVSWEPIAGTEDLRIGVLAIDPHDANLVLGAVLYDDDLNLLRSDDGGAHWAPSNVGIEGTVRGLTFSANGAEVVAAGDGGVFRSADRGRTWQPVPGSPPARAILRQTNGTLHVATGAGVLSLPTTPSP